MAESTTTPRRGATVQTAAITETDPEVQNATPDSIADGSDSPAVVEEVDADELKWREVDGIRYTGTADVKQYSAEDLKKLGFDGAEEGVEWTRSSPMVPKKHFNAAALREIVGQPDFEAY